MPDTARARPSVEEAAKKIRLPACPAILTRLLKEMRADEPDFVKIAKLIGSDVSLAGAMVKTVNSPFYGLAVKIASVQQALNVIGLRNASQLVTGLLLRDAFQSGATEKMQTYWQSTLKIALLNALLARSFGIVDREEAYTFGLFRDCGVLAMMVDVDGYQPTLPGAVVCGTRVLGSEDERYETNHAAVGYYLTKSWLVPEHICEAVLHHHEYQALHDGSLKITSSSMKHIALAIASEWLYLTKAVATACPQWAEASAFVLGTLDTSESALLQIVEDVDL